MSKELVLVSCSSGLDSTSTLKVLQLSDYDNIIACHFRYGTRSDEAEFLAITNICKKLSITLKVFDVRGLYKEMESESISMLENENSEIITGTIKGLKTVAAWHPNRNGLFQTIMTTFAECEVMKHNYSKVHFCAGWNQLSESSTYPDNSEAFSGSCMNMAKYSTLVGDRFSILYCLSNLMKTEQYVLASSFKYLDLLDMCISCDRAKIVNGIPCNCMKNGLPACGSGLLSRWSENILGLKTNRNFYEVEDEGYIAHVPKHMTDGVVRTTDVNSIIDRILIPEDKKQNLRNKLISIQQDSTT